MLVQNTTTHDIQSANLSGNAVPKCNFCTLDCTLEEIAVLNFLREQPKATQKEIATHIGKSERTVKSITVKLTKKAFLSAKTAKEMAFGRLIQMT